MYFDEFSLFLNVFWMGLGGSMMHGRSMVHGPSSIHCPGRGCHDVEAKREDFRNGFG